MAISVVSGVVSHFQQSTEIRGAANVGAGAIGSVQVLNFRIGGQPVTFKFTESGISNGDIVTAAGYTKKGTLRVLSLKNQTTGATQSTTSVFYFVFAVILLLIGVPLSFFIIGGVPLVLVGMYCGYLGWRNVQASRVVAAAPRPATA